MKWSLEGGTDAASMVLFDPASLPLSFDQAVAKDGGAESLDEAHRAGQLFWFESRGDGGYTLSIYLDEEPTAEIQQYAQRDRTAAELHVRSGRLFFTGIEYAFHRDDSRLRRYPTMGESADVPSGTYLLDVYTCEYPPQLRHSVLRQRFGTFTFALHRIDEALLPMGCLATVVAFLSVVWIGWRWWLRIVLPLLLATYVASALFHRLPACRRVRRAKDAVDRDFPDYVAVLRRSTRGSLRHKSEQVIAPGVLLDRDVRELVEQTPVVHL